LRGASIIILFTYTTIHTLLVEDVVDRDNAIHCCRRVALLVEDAWPKKSGK
jgi:hypothetical protein